MRSKKGQTAYGIVFVFIIVAIVWIIGLSEMVSFWGKRASESPGVSGLAALIFANLNLFIILIGVIAFMLWFTLLR